MSLSLSAQSLVIGVIPSNAEPYAFIRDSELSGGIIKEIGDTIGKQLTIAVKYRFSSRKRIEEDMVDGRINVISIYNRAWTAKPDKYLWSPALFSERNILLVSKKRPFAISTAADLRGKRVGTILGYVYPNLQALFDKGIAIREDARTLEQNIEKLRAGRIDVVCDSDLLTSFQIRNAHDEFQIAEWVVSSQSIYFCYSQNLPIPAEKLNAVLLRMRNSGVLEKILQKYR